MENVIDALKAERTHLRARLTKIDAAIEEYERWARSVFDLVGNDQAPAAVNSVIGPEVKQTPMADFEGEVRALLGRASGPLKRNEVYEELAKSGVVVGGKEPLNTVASRLSRMKGSSISGLWLLAIRAALSAAPHRPTESTSSQASSTARCVPDQRAKPPNVDPVCGRRREMVSKGTRTKVASNTERGSCKHSGPKSAGSPGLACSGTGCT